MHDELGSRLKRNYENASKTFLTRRMPVIIRIDGKAFHTFTRGLKKPFDGILSDAMQKTMEYLCKNIQGCVFGYTQSDEISLLLVDYKNLNTDAWFNYSVQKCASVASSMATMSFNKAFADNVEKWLDEYYMRAWNADENDDKYAETLKKALENGAMFDARIFNIPKEEVVNYFIWRQNDCGRNCVQSVAQSMLSKSEIFHKSCSELIDIIGDKFEYQPWQMLGTSMLKEFSGSTPTSVCVDGISGMANRVSQWNFRCFNFKENRSVIERTFLA